MREILFVWRNPRMILLTVVTTVVYAGLLIPFKQLAVLPGFSSVRPANVIPIAAGLMFGPAGAWGSMLGNIIADLLGGTWTAGSYFGAVGNFFTSVVAYRLWGNLGRLSAGMEPDMQSGQQFPEFVVLTAGAACITASIIGWGSEIVRLLPFGIFAGTIVFNNSLAALFLGPPLLYLLYPQIKERGWLYHQILDENSLPARHARQRQAAIVLLGLSIAWFVLGMSLSLIHDGVSVRSVLRFEAISAAGSLVQVATGGGMFCLVVVASWVAGERLSSLDTSSSMSSGVAPLIPQRNESADTHREQPVSAKSNVGVVAILSLGVVLTGLYATTVLMNVATGSRPLDIVLYQLSIGLVVPAGLIGAAWWLGRTDYSPERVWAITIWTFGGLGVVTTLSVWQFSYVFLGVSLTGHVIESFFLNVQAGAAGGFLIGNYYVRAESASEALDEAQKKYSTLGEKTHDGVAIVQDGVFTFVNPQMASILSRSESDLDGQQVMDIVVPEYREMIEQRYEKRVSGDDVPDQYEIEIQTPEGKRRYVDIQAKLIRSDGRPATLVTAKDITDWKNMEERLREQRDTVELLNHVLCHDIVNEIDLIMQLTRRYTDESENGENNSDQLLESCERILNLLEASQELMSAVSEIHTDRESIPLVRILEREAAVAADQASNADITLERPLPDVEVLADDTLDTVLRNLLSNAVEHNDAATPSVDISVTKRSSHVLVRIADNGPGIPEEQKEKIFRPDVGSGENSTSGLGLYLVKSLVNRYGGDIWIEDNDSTGSVFVLSLETAASK